MVKFTKILKFRIISPILLITVSACSSGPERRTNDNAGPFSAGTRNEIAQKDPEGLVRVGEGFERSGNYANALNLFEQALSVKPDLISAQIAKGRILSRSAKHTEGILILQDIVRNHPEQNDAILTLAQAHTFNQDYDKAYVVITPLAQSGDATVSHLNLAGSLAEVLDLNDVAKTYYDKALQIDPNNMETLIQVAISFALEGEYQTATALLQPILNTPRHKQTATTALANIYALSGQLEAANVIVKSLPYTEETKQSDKFFQLLDTMNKREQAITLLFNVVPKSILERSS
jgi:Flp pilus assembly protein TadD